MTPEQSTAEIPWSEFKFDSEVIRRQCNAPPSRFISISDAKMAVAMKPHWPRVIEEKDQLDERIEKLEAFLSSTKVDEVDNNGLNLLGQQLDAMQHYSDVLRRRLETA